ncbi:MAG: hypothetical protein KFW07_00435 [Mycoplasmataceae bacterium]|nr:hypothetical protein [Mycoplasmataceae bacterium]
MIIKFKSTYGKSNDDMDIIEFTSQLKKFVDGSMTVLEFIEPSNNIQNRIEYNDKKVSIYAGPTTIDLEINKLIKNNFVTEHGTIIIVSFMRDIKINHNLINISYSLNDEIGNLINNFFIELHISN